MNSKKKQSLRFWSSLFATSVEHLWSLDITYVISHLQSYWEITSDDYLAYIGKYVVGLGPWKDTIVPAAGNYLMPPSDLVARAHAHNLQVHHLFVGNVCYANHLHMETMETPIWTTGSRSKGGRRGSERGICKSVIT